MSEEIKAKELDAKLKAQERVTQPLHPEDIPFFLGESVEVQKTDAHDMQDAKRNNIARSRGATPCLPAILNQIKLCDHMCATAQMPFPH